jgi:hypothetical protein
VTSDQGLSRDLQIYISNCVKLAEPVIVTGFTRLSQLFLRLRFYIQILQRLLREKNTENRTSFNILPNKTHVFDNLYFAYLTAKGV